MFVWRHFRDEEGQVLAFVVVPVDSVVSRRELSDDKGRRGLPDTALGMCHGDNNGPNVARFKEYTLTATRMVGSETCPSLESRVRHRTQAQLRRYGYRSNSATGRGLMVQAGVVLLTSPAPTAVHG
jgi:hypothetical protein